MRAGAAGGTGRSGWEHRGGDQTQSRAKEGFSEEASEVSCRKSCQYKGEESSFPNIFGKLGTPHQIYIAVGNRELGGMRGRGQGRDPIPGRDRNTKPRYEKGCMSLEWLFLGSDLEVCSGCPRPL